MEDSALKPRRAWLVTLAVSLAIAGVAAATIAGVHAAANGGVLQPQGSNASSELRLFVFAALLSLIVVIPVFGGLLFVSIRYRERPRGKQQGPYAPRLQGNRLIELVWWAVPGLLITVIGVTTWTGSHELDPYVALKGSRAAVTIDVVALQWKWLFLYPASGVATVNELDIPANTPIQLNLTADAPMNSFWIPQLTGQVYAMPGMETHLNFDATTTGDYSGESANISGSGFSTMRFVVHARDPAAFTSWANRAAQSSLMLDASRYDRLRIPSAASPAATYRCMADDLYGAILAHYMGTPPPLPSAQP